VALTTMLAPLNSTMIGVALPQITKGFGVDLAQSGWLVIAYLVVMASLQPVAGKLGDRLGHRRLILVGLVYFALASLGAATATSLTGLLVFRIQQAIAGALALPNGIALMRQVVPAAERGRRFGLVGSAVVLAAAAGPPLSGILIELTDWRAIFYINLLFIGPALIIGLRVLPKKTAPPSDLPFDLLGATLLLSLLAGTAGLLTLNADAGGLSALGWCSLGAIAVLFIRREWHHPDPLIQPRLFRRRTFTAVNAAIALSNLAMYTTFLAIPLLLDQRPGWNSAKAGLVLAALWAPTVVCAPLGGRLADRWGRRWPTAIGLTLLAVGLSSLLSLSEAIEQTVLLASLSLAGIGLGLSHAGMQTAAIEAVPRQAAGVAAGIFSTSRYLGSIIGSSVLPILFISGSGIDGFVQVMIMVSGAAFLAVLASLGIDHWPREE
jgi:EmrB/QacA subfamily drug resistance transporter